MAISQAQLKATQKYQKKTYDQIVFRVKKGIKESYTEQAAKENKSLNQFIIDCIQEHIEKQN